MEFLPTPIAVIMAEQNLELFKLLLLCRDTAKFTSQVIQSHTTVETLASGTKQYRFLGRLHREGGPAMENATSLSWYRHGRLHRDGGPAVEYRHGTKKWYRCGQLHRIDGPAVEYGSGSREWYQFGKRHRDGGPAIERYDSSCCWYRHDVLHREDGPALELKMNINSTFTWYLYGVAYTFEDHRQRRESDAKHVASKHHRRNGARRRQSV